MTSLWPDLRLALRGLRRSPLFAAVAILSLALGIGANTAIFTLIDQILLRKLPVRDPSSSSCCSSGATTTAATWDRGCTRIPSIRTTSRKPSRSRRSSARRLVPHPWRRQPDRTCRGRDGVGQLLRHARRRSRGRPGAALEDDDQVYNGHPSSCTHDYWVSTLRHDPESSARRSRSTTTR